MTSILAFIIIIFLLGLSIGAIILGIKYRDKTYEEWPEFTITIGIVCTVIMAIALIIASIISINFRVHEDMYYAALLAEHDTLEASIHMTTDIINTDLYLEIVNHNKEVASKAVAYKSPLYFFQFSHKYDWSAIPLIDVGQN